MRRIVCCNASCWKASIVTICVCHCFHVLVARWCRITLAYMPGLPLKKKTCKVDSNTFVRNPTRTIHITETLRRLNLDDRIYKKETFVLFNLSCLTVYKVSKADRVDLGDKYNSTRFKFVFSRLVFCKAGRHITHRAWTEIKETLLCVVGYRETRRKHAILGQ